MRENELAASESDEENTQVYYNYKDRVFRLLFKNRKRLLELYNALNGTDYNNEEDLIVNTLENAIFIKMKNDLSFIIVPTPHYIVFYNGFEKSEEEFYLKLSDAFEDDSKGCMELTVRVININYGKNKDLLEKCKSLYGYAYFVAAIRRNLQDMEMERAVEGAVDECIEKDILREFLLEQKAEVIAMSIYEYNEEYVKKTIREEGYEEGKTHGDAKRLVKSVNTVMRNLKMDLEKACESIGTTVEEYEKAKEEISK